MHKYYDFMICGCYLYFTSHSIIEAMHVYACDKRHKCCRYARRILRYSS